jgi:large subunit ribosomal protein L18
MNIDKKQRRILRTRSKIKKFEDRPRLVVFRSNKNIQSQIIDSKGNVLATALSKEIKSGKTKTEKADLTGELLAKRALEKKIKKVVFDRAGYKFHGRIKALAEAARKGGLDF